LKQLSGYYNKLDMGKQAFRVHYGLSKKCLGYGRVFALHSLGCTSFSRDVRALLLQGR
jgi:hypothetical protein